VKIGHARVSTGGQSAVSPQLVVEWTPVGAARCRCPVAESPARQADADDALARLQHPIPLCADESCRTLADLDRLDGEYEAINIKLDKAG
jgi:hypothetical protein